MNEQEKSPQEGADYNILGKGSTITPTQDTKLPLPRFITIAPNLAVWIDSIQEIKIITKQGKPMVAIRFASHKSYESFLIDESYTRRFLELNGRFFFEPEAIEEALKVLL